MLLLLKFTGALSDLNKALELATPGRTRCQALCQRGLLLRKQEKLDEAKLDFTEAVKLGSKFAKSQVGSATLFVWLFGLWKLLLVHKQIHFQLIEINPYAALCNQMLREAFDKLK